MDKKLENREEMIFYEALEKDPEQRGIYLIEACGGDQKLLKRVKTLLQAYETDDTAHHVPDGTCTSSRR